MHPSTPPATVLRLFIAIELPPAARQQVQEKQRHLRQELARVPSGDPFRWTTADNLHLTLRFLGDTTAAQRVQVEETLAKIVAGFPTFHLAVQKVDAFPNLRKPNIIWLDFAGDLPVLIPLQQEIELAAQAAGFAAEQRAYTPHLTIARAQKSAAPAALAQAGEVLKNEIAAPTAAPRFFAVDQVHLIRSDLRPSGSIYTTLGSFSLRP